MTARRWRAWRVGGIAVLAAAIAWAQTPPPAPAATAPSASVLPGAQLLAALSRGGYVLPT